MRFVSGVPELRRKARNPERRNSCAEQNPRQDKRDNAERKPAIRILYGFFFLRFAQSGIGSVRGRARIRLREWLHRKFRFAHKAVTLARNRFDVERFFGGVAKDLPQLVHRGIYVRIEIYVRVRRPERRLQFFARNHLAGLRDERKQYLIDLALQFQAASVAVDLLALLIDLK